MILKGLCADHATQYSRYSSLPLSQALQASGKYFDITNGGSSERTFFPSKREKYCNCTLSMTHIFHRETVLSNTRDYKKATRLLTTGNVLLIPSQETRTRNSHKYKYRVPRTTNDILKYSFYPRTLREWNRLPKEIILANSLEIFKSELKTYLKQFLILRSFI